MNELLNHDKHLTLWVNASQNKYFLIPTNEYLPEGDFLIIAISGKEKKVNINALTAFEIKEAEASKYIESQIKEVTENAKIPLVEIAKSALQQETQFSTDEDLIIDFIAKFTNSSPEQIKQKPELAKVGLEQFIEQFKLVLDSSLDDKSSNYQELSQQISPLQDILKVHKVDMGNLLEKFPENLQQLSSLSDSHAQETTAKIKEFSQNIDTNQEDFGQMLLKFIETYNRLFISQKTEEAIRISREQEYEKIADKAIKDSLAQHPMPSFTFEDLL
jgi:hypothetical protein